MVSRSVSAHQKDGPARPDGCKLRGEEGRASVSSVGGGQVEVRRCVKDALGVTETLKAAEAAAPRIARLYGD